MNLTAFITIAEALELHKQLIKRFGGKKGIRDMGLLESSLMRPQTGYYKTLSQQAAALLQSLAQNHPFVDGNKRVAFAAMAIFLRMNNYKLITTADEGESFLVDNIIQDKISMEDISNWIEKHMEKVSS